MTKRDGLCLCGCGEATNVASKTSKARGDAQGQPLRYVYGHQSRLQNTVAGYHHRTLNGSQKRVHVHRAEKALGKPLPKGAIVHHADGSKSDSAQLVICQDQRYHMLLHLRMRIRDAGGNPDTESVCIRCRVPKPRSMFATDSRRILHGVEPVCRDCSNAEKRARYWSTRSN